jgi:hypothetical protein
VIPFNWILSFCLACFVNVKITLIPFNWILRFCLVCFTNVKISLIPFNWILRFCLVCFTNVKISFILTLTKHAKQKLSIQLNGINVILTLVKHTKQKLSIQLFTCIYKSIYDSNVHCSYINTSVILFWWFGSYTICTHSMQ